MTCYTYLLLCRSQEGYRAPQSKDELPQVYHYYPRDSRRGVEAPAVTLNTTDTAALPAGQSSNVMVSRTLVRPPAPTNRRLQPASSQPDSEGYFPIVNFK